MAFGTSSNDVNIKVTVDADGAIKAFDSLGNEMQITAKSADAAAQGFSKTQASLVSLNSGIELAKKAYDLLTTAAGAGIDAIKRGAEVDDISASFENLASKAGATGDAFLNQLNSAVGETIPNLDLMKQANELLLGGIKPDKITLLAEASRALGEQTGVSAAEGMDALSSSILKGNDIALKRLGITIDNNQALIEFAEKNGIAADQIKNLSEEAKKLANQDAVFKALAAESEKFGLVTIDAGDQIERVSKLITDKFDDVYKSIAGDAGVNQGLEELVQKIKSIDIQQFASDVASLITYFTSLASDGVLVAVEALKVFRETLDSISGVISGKFTGIEHLVNQLNPKPFKEFNSSIDDIVDLLSKDTPEAAEKAATAYAKLKSEISSGLYNIGTVKHAVGDLQNLKKQIEETGKAAGKANLGEFVGPKLFVGPVNKAIDEINKIKPALLNAGSGADEAKKKVNELSQATEGYKEALRKVLGQQALPAVSTELGRVFAQLKDGSITTSDAERMIRSLSQAYADSPEKIKAFQTAVEEAAAAAEKAVDQGAILKGLYENNLAEIEAASLEWSKNFASTLEQAVADALGSAVSAGLDSAVNGGSARDSIEKMGQALGTAIGAAVGSFFGPVGTAVGGAVGGIVGEEAGGGVAKLGKDSQSTRKGLQQLATLFAFVGGAVYLAFDAAFGDAIFSSNESTVTRKALDKWFAEQFDAKRIGVIIDGQLEQLKDFEFGGGLFGTAESSATQFFGSLSSEAQTTFTGVAGLFTDLLGLGRDVADELGAVLAENLGGSLNNLQLTIEGMGLSFEKLREVTINAFLDGKISALEAQQTLASLAQVAQKGIPDGIGFTIQAFDNLKAAGAKGGRALIDALQDIGYEAKELGIRDFGGLIKNLTESGKFSQEEIQQVFATLQKYGINSIEQLTNATNEQLIPVLADLQANGFDFADAEDSTQKLIEQFEKIPEEKKLKIIVETEFDENTQTAQSQGLFKPGLNPQGSGVSN